jgi:hypothetical protein
MFGNTFEGLGAPKRRRKSRKSGRSSSACRTGQVRFKTKRGKVITFKGKTGPGCGPRKKPTTRHLAPYKRKLASAAKSCKGLSKNQFQSCVASEMHKGGFGRRRR